MDKLSQLLSPEALALLTARGTSIFERIGIDVIRGIVLDILMGRNLRSSTELLTRSRIAALNLATLQLFIKGASEIENFVEQLPLLASDTLMQGRLSRADKWLAQWVLGLTDKGVQNILRDDPAALEQYRNGYIKACQEIIETYQNKYGELSGSVNLPGGLQAELSWLFLLYLFTTIGAQTLTIRGSDKSTYGKLFEKLILGSLLHILGFKYVPRSTLEQTDHVFWMSSSDDKRESDATLLYDAGRGVRFDIGFIGRGNTEISLDKVTRYQREIDFGRTTWYMATFIVVDRIGRNSRITELAERVQGTIIQMSASYWVKIVASRLHQILGFDHPILHMDDHEIELFIQQALETVPLHSFIQLQARDNP